MECQDGAHVVTVYGQYYSGYEGEYESLVLKRQAIGICEADELLLDDAMPFEPEPDIGSGSEYSSTVVLTPPNAHVVYRYTPYGMRPDGSLVTIRHYCDNDFRGYGLSVCEEAPIQRGQVWEGISGGSPVFFVSTCEADCWTEFGERELSLEEFEQLSGEPASGLVGQVVDVYGDRTYCAMPGGDSQSITRIERAPDGVCGPVPAQRFSWGSVKAMYH